MGKATKHTEAEVQESHLLLSDRAEVERMQLQAKVWEPEAVAMLDAIGIHPGWRTADLGCGGRGILGPLAHRVGPGGRVVGVDTDSHQLAAARAYLSEERLANVELVEADACHTGLSRESFDLTHVRFLFTPMGRDEELLEEMLALTKPGGYVVVEEPDCASWNFLPVHSSFTELKAALEAATAKAGGDLHAGRKMFGLLRHARLEEVQVRAAVLALHDGHPYMRMPVLTAHSVRARLLDSGLLTESTLQRVVEDCEHLAADPNTLMLSFVVLQVWGRKPRR